MHPNPDRPAGPSDAPFLGVGVGLRTVHYEDVLGRDPSGGPGVDWFELLSENYMVPGGRPLRIVDEIRERVPVALHGVSLNIGSTDPLSPGYLDELDRLVRRARPAWISDHLCWTGVGGTNLHDLLPLPYVDDVIDHVAGRVRRVQDRLGRRIALENVSSYMSFTVDSMSEWEFLTTIAEEADCGILLDVNNVFVSAHNHGFDPMKYIDSIPPERVFQIHLAGHSSSGDMLIDTHDHPVTDAVWGLYERAIERIGPVSTLIEWDDRIPTWPRLVEEAEKARDILERVTTGGATDAAS
ncbi:MAG TPA: DUF692 domain-containing protein [Deltaproteobacteria bacterium]|nr:DUF692 domain-containing protein [Deltaproteobacteria bacterium]